MRIGIYPLNPDPRPSNISVEPRSKTLGIYPLNPDPRPSNISVEPRSKNKRDNSIVIISYKSKVFI